MFRRGGRRRATGQPVLDTVYLGRLAAHLGRDTVLELLADGLIELTDRLAGLARRAAEGDRAGALRLTHDITGLAGHLGLSALSLAAAQANRGLRTCPAAQVPALAAPVARAGEAALAALAAALREGEAGLPAG